MQTQWSFSANARRTVISLSLSLPNKELHDEIQSGALMLIIIIIVAPARGINSYTQGHT